MTIAAFNGGPGNCPAGRCSGGQDVGEAQTRAFNGGPGNCPAGRSIAGVRARSCVAGDLQWRAGQLPGRTSTVTPALRPVVCRFDPSMEGRAIARPDQVSSSCVQAREADGSPSMEGRAIARPDARCDDVHRPATRRSYLQWRAGQLPGRTAPSNPVSIQALVAVPSMEGRAIARPDDRDVLNGHAQHPPSGTFNGGPGNCPAGPGLLPRSTPPARSTDLPFNGGPGNCPAGPLMNADGADSVMPVQPSMEGRAIARPDTTMLGAVHATAHCRSFNGGPGNCPAGRWCSSSPPNGRIRWRIPSMEGRAIARPDRSLDLGRLKCLFAGVCERSRKR